MISLLRNLARSERGTVTIELAIVAPVLAVLIIGVTDISMAYSHKLEIEQGAQRAIEKVMQTTGDTTVADTIKKEAVCQVNGTNADGTCATGRLTTDDVTVTYRLECTDGGGVVSNSETDDATIFDGYSCASGSSEARYIMATVRDVYTPMFPIHFGTDPDGTYHLGTTAGVRVQ